MAAAQVAKKLKDRRQKHTLEEIFRKVDRDGNGSISLSEYFGIFEEHGVNLSQAECNRVVKLAGDNGLLKKDEFIKIIRGSNFFIKTFDKNQDGIVSETEMTTRAELAFKALDKDGSGYITSKELKKLSTKLSTSELKGLMKKLDSDGDGKLTFEEFKKMFEKLEIKGGRHPVRKDSSSDTPRPPTSTIPLPPQIMKGSSCNNVHIQQSNNKKKDPQRTKTEEVGESRESRTRMGTIGKRDSRSFSRSILSTCEAGNKTRQCSPRRKSPAIM